MTASVAHPHEQNHPHSARRRRTWWQMVAYVARRACWMEVRSYQGIYRWVFRRPRTPPGAAAFSYHQPVLAILIVFIVVSAVELVVVDLIVHRWTAVRVPLLVVGIWGLVWMFGLLCGMLTRPHAVGPAGLRIRSGLEVDLALSWDDIAVVTSRRRARGEKEPKITSDDGVTTLHLRMADETNIEITLEQPIEFHLPHGRETVDRIALYAHDDCGYMDEVRRHIG